MSNTSFDLTQAATLFQDISIALNKKVHDQLQTLSQHEIMDLMNRSTELAVKSSLMFAMAVVKIGEEAKDSLDSLRDAKQQLDEVISKVQQVQQIVDLAAKLVSTASAIITGDAPKIISNIKDTLGDMASLKATG